MASFLIIKKDSRYKIVISKDLINIFIDDISPFAKFFSVTFIESEEIIKGSVDKKDTNSFSFLSNDFFSLSININQHEDKIDCLISADEWLIANKILGNYCLSIDDVEKYRPIELNYDYLRVSFEKGCYRGQEIVARMKYLGVNRRKFSTIVIDQNSNITETFKIFGDIINQKGFDIFNCMIKRDDLETISNDGSIKLII